MTQPVLASRKANALLSDVSAAVVPANPLAALALRRKQRRAGGLWVGGTATLTATELSFAANALNRSVHHGDVDVRLDVGSITGIAVDATFGMKTVVVEAEGRVLRLRCYRAEAFADQVHAAAAGDHPDGG